MANFSQQWRLEMIDLTEKQSKIFEFIVREIKTNCMPPTRAEIAKNFNFSSINAAEDHLQALARKGFIQLRTGKARGIFVVGGV